MENATELTTYINNISNNISNSKYIPIEQNSDSNQIYKEESLDSYINNIGIPYKNPPEKKEKIIPVNSDKIKTILDNEPPKYYFYKKLGNSFSYLGNKYGDPLIIIGPNWQMYVCLSLLISSLYYFGYINCWYFIDYIYKLIGLSIYSIFILSYTYTFLINPGYPKNDINSRKGEPRENFEYCYDCKIWVNKNKKVEHCIVCDICIEENDHHCIWTSKCIGKNNFYSFKIFVISTFISLIYGIIILIIAKINIFQKKLNQ